VSCCGQHGIAGPIGRAHPLQNPSAFQIRVESDQAAAELIARHPGYAAERRRMGPRAVLVRLTRRARKW